MAKFDSSVNGYRLTSGKIVTPGNVEELGYEEIKELAETHISGWDMLLLRQKLHVVENSIAAYITNADDMFKEIKDALTVTVKNGTEKTLPIGKVVAGLYERETPKRNRLKLIEAVKVNSIIIICLLAIIVIGTVYFTKQEWFLTGLIPILIAIGKKIIEN